MKYLTCFIIILSIYGIVNGELNRTHPLSATTALRMETYNDSYRTVYLTTNTVDLNHFNYYGSSHVFTNPFQIVTVYYWNEWKSDIVISTLTLNEFAQMVIRQTKMDVINKSLDNDIEQYMVYPSSYLPRGVEDWKGYCSEVINGQVVAFECPKQ